MTESTSRRNYKLEDLPLTESIEHLDTLEHHREYLNTDTDIIAFQNSNSNLNAQVEANKIGHTQDLYDVYSSNNAYYTAKGHPEVLIPDTYDNDSYVTHSTQKHLVSKDFTSENKSKGLQALDRTAEVHTYSILPETAQEEDQNITNRLMNTQFYLDNQRTKRNRTFDAEEVLTESIHRSPEIIVEDIHKPYKNYGITHGQDLMSSCTGFYVSNQVDDAELMEEVQIDNDEEDHEAVEQEGTIEVQRRALMNNPGIGTLISESSKQIDKINKMLEEHRKKKAVKMTNQHFDNVESGNSENPFDQATSSNTEIIQEDLSIPDSTNRPSNSDKNVLKTGSKKPGLQQRVSGSSIGASEDSLGDKIKDPKERPKEVIDSSGQASLDNLVENMITAREEYEAAFREENGVDIVTLGKVDEEERALKRYNSQERASNLGSVELRDGKKLNKIQLDYAKYQAGSSKQPRQSNSSQSRQHLRGIEKATSKERRAQKKTQHSKEKYTYNTRDFSKEDAANFFSVNFPRPNDGTTQKKAKLSAKKDKGSYLKKFLEHKEKRRIQDPTNQNIGTQSSRSRKKNSNSSRGSRSSNRSIYKLSSKDSKRVRQTVGSSMGVDSGDYNDRSEKSTTKERSSAPNHYAKGFMNDTEGSDKKLQNAKLTRYNELRNVHKNSKKESSLNPLDHQLSKLDLNHILPNQVRDDSYSLKNKNGRLEDTVKDKMQLNMDKVNLGGHSLSAVGSFNPLNSRRENQCSDIEYTRPVPQTSRAMTNRDYDTSRSRNAEKNNIENLNYEQQNQGLQTYEHQNTADSSGATSSISCKVTQESLMKSLKLRQEMYAKVFKNHKHHNSQGTGLRKDGGTSANILSRKKDEEEKNIYSKNVKWLMSKQRKLDEMHSREIEQEMRECTFKPHLVTKELNLKQDLNLCDYVNRMRAVEPVSRVLVVEQK